MQDEIKNTDAKKSCANCGAALAFKPGSTHLECVYCGYEEFIEQSKSSFEELELSHYLKVVGDNAFTDKIALVKCKSCGSNQHIKENFKSLSCVYCSEPLLIEDVQKEGWIMPGAVLPFQIDKNQSRQLFFKWINSLWFAPNKLKKAALDPEKLHGLYVPYWTFDANLSANYSGMRGDYYYETRTIRTSKGTKTQQVRKIRWSSASGSVKGFVDDILVSASAKRKNQIPTKIYGWDLKKLQTFNQQFLNGFVTEKYTVSLKEGHQTSFKRAKQIAHQWIRRDIGGDTQQIHHADITLKDESFKHILLPVYLSSYRYNGKLYQFFINGENGKISGDRPISYWKIFFAVLAGLIVIGGLIAVFGE